MLLVWIALPFGLAANTSADATELSRQANVGLAFRQLYNFDFAASRETAQSYVRTKGEDPMGYASLAAAYLFSEMNRLEVFNKDMLREEKVSGEQAKKIGEESRRGFVDAVAKTKQAAEAALAKNPKDANALRALVIATGAERDFAALVEKRLKDSYYAAKASQEYALRLQAVDPADSDAWFTRGFSEYLVGSVPFVLRWLMKIEQVKGDKDKGVAYMEICANRGNYLKPFAQMMLATIYQKEKRWKEQRAMLEAFAADHPENTTVKRELAKLDQR
ncbi:MAG: hypothetical protein OHK0021_00660 [Bryobacter sp.]